MMIVNRRRHYSQEDVVKIDDYPNYIRIDCSIDEEYKWEMGYFAGDILLSTMIIDGTTTTSEGRYYGPYKRLSAGNHIIYMKPIGGDTGDYQTFDLPKGTTYIRLPYNITTKWRNITNNPRFRVSAQNNTNVILDILDTNVVYDVYSDAEWQRYKSITVPKGSKAKYIEYKNKSNVINLIKEVKFKYTEV